MRSFVVLFSMLISSVGFAKMADSAYVARCVSAITEQEGTSLKIKCSATTASGESQLRRHGYNTSYVLDLADSSKVKVKSWGIPGKSYASTISYRVKAAPYRWLPGKSLELNCFETKGGDVRISSGPAASISTQTRVDDIQKVELACVRL